MNNTAEMISKETNVQSDYLVDEIHLLDLVEIVACNLRKLIFLPLLAGIISLGITFFIQPIYSSRTSILPPGQSINQGGANSMGQLSVLANLAGVPGKSPIDQAITFLQSNSVLDLVVKEAGLVGYYQVEDSLKARNTLKGASKFEVDKKNVLILIEVSDKDPKIAANIANTYVHAISRFMGDLSAKEALAKREILSKQVSEAMGRTYQSPLVRDGIIQSLLRDYEIAQLEANKNPPLIIQIDTAEPPTIRTKPNRTLSAIITSSIVGFMLLIFYFLKHISRRSLKNEDTVRRWKGSISTIKSQLFFINKIDKDSAKFSK